MPIHAWWKSVVTTWKRWRPVRRRRTWAGFSVEAFEPRRLLSAFVVNSTLDTHDATPGDGIAADANGRTTLRAAIEEANAHAGADTITLLAGIFALSSANGPLAVTDDLTIVGSNGRSEIDGTVFDEVFSLAGSTHLQLDGVVVRSSHDLAASLRPLLLTTNARQTDLIVAFSATPSTPLNVETKTSNGLSPLIGLATSESIFDELPTTSDTKKMTDKSPAVFDEFAVPTPDQAIDQIINALFHSEPLDLVLPAGAEQKPVPMSESGTQLPMPKTGATQKSASEEAPPNFESESPTKGMSLDDSEDDDEQSLTSPTDDEAVRTVLRGWANDAGWNEFDVLMRGSRAVATKSTVSRVTAMASVLLSGVVATSWSRGDHTHSWRDSLSLASWRQRFERLRRRAR